MRDQDVLFDRDGVARADVVLGLVPIVFAAVYGVSAAAFEAWTVSIAGGAIVSATLIADTLFRHPPGR